MKATAKYDFELVGKHSQTKVLKGEEVTMLCCVPNNCYKVKSHGVEGIISRLVVELKIERDDPSVIDNNVDTLH